MFIHDKQINFLDVKHCQLLIDNISNVKHKLIVLLMLDCGLRVTEAVSLKLSNFDFKRKLVTVYSLKKRDTNSFRTIPLSDRLYIVLAEYLYGKKLINFDYLFPGTIKNNHLRRESVNRFLDRYKKKFNIPNLHPHALRHTCATQHIANGTPLENVKEILGHKKYDTTLIYAKIPAEVLRQNISNVTKKRISFWQRLWCYIFPNRVKTININVSPNNIATVGRSSEISLISSFVNRDINTLLLGDIGVGKSHLLAVIEPVKRVLKLDDTDNIKKSLIYILLFLLDNDKQALKNLIFSDLPLDKIKTKLNRESVRNLCDEIKKLSEPKEYVLCIDSLDRVTPKTVKILEELKDHFTIIASARDIPLNKTSFLWNFEIIRVKPLPRSDALDLINKLSYDLEVEDFELFRNHIYEQSNGTPRVIFEIIDRYRKEPVITNEVVRDIRHFGSLKEIDMSMLVVLFIASLAVLRYLSREVDNSSFRFIGGAAMILLIISRYFFSSSKRKFL